MKCGPVTLSVSPAPVVVGGKKEWRAGLGQEGRRPASVSGVAVTEGGYGYSRRADCPAVRGDSAALGCRMGLLPVAVSGGRGREGEGPGARAGGAGRAAEGSVGSLPERTGTRGDPSLPEDGGLAWRMWGTVWGRPRPGVGVATAMLDPGIGVDAAWGMTLQRDWLEFRRGDPLGPASGEAEGDEWERRRWG